MSGYRYIKKLRAEFGFGSFRGGAAGWRYMVWSSDDNRFSEPPPPSLSKTWPPLVVGLESSNRNDVSLSIV